MGETRVFVNNQSYTITCDDGEEKRLQEMALYFDSHVQEIAGQVGKIADARLMLLAGITLADKLHEYKDLIQSNQQETNAADILDSATQKIYTLVQELDANLTDDPLDS